MTCSQIEEMLALYADHELPEKRQQMVTAHLQACTECSLAAAEYRDLHGLMRDFAPPVFDEEVYAQIRKNVWQQIESQPQTRTVFESIATWFRPRFAWAAASALMIAVAFVGLYFIVNEFSVRPAVIVDVPRVVTPAFGPAPETQSGVSLHPDKGPLPPRQVIVPKRPRQPDRMVAPDRGDALVAYSPDAGVAAVQQNTGATAASETLAPQSPDPPVIGTGDLGSKDQDKTLRMEIQTKNPNIRIIWFSQREPKPLTTPAKGI